MPADAVKNALYKVDESGDYIVETNLDIPLSGVGGPGIARCNVYRPKATKEGLRCPVLMTMGPYGKDIYYGDFHPKSFSEVPKEHHSKHSAWEVPDPAYWTAQNYILIRVDERGTGQSPGHMDTMSASTASDFACCIEWAAEQPWCTGKVGLLGISYYGGSQWRVAARQPKGLACIIPWEGMSDYYRDRCRQGGIYSNTFINRWWNRQVLSNQYGLAGKAARNWGPDTIEGDIPEEQLRQLRNDQTVDNQAHRYLDEPYYASREYDKGDITVPLLSVANWGGILLHLRGNVVGYLEAGSKNKWLYFITGRHDLPFYLPEYVKLQKSFLDAWLKGEDDAGWLEGPNKKVPAISYLLRSGNPGYNDIEADRSFPRCTAPEWPLPNTQYTKVYLNKDLTLSSDPKPAEKGEIVYEALTGEPVLYKTGKFKTDTEITGHPLVNLSMAVRAKDGNTPKDLDVMLTLRHYGPDGQEIFYTGTTGDPVPLCKGFLRASLRQINKSSPLHKPYLPYREYSSKDVAFLSKDQPVDLLVELWPTSVLVQAGGSLSLEIAPKDTQGCGIFKHDDPVDRSPEVFAGLNVICLGGGSENWLQLPVVSGSL